MRQAIRVAKAALDIGEVPVGCVIVMPTENGPVVVSHGANQVNATRDATRHAEIVAIDRMLTGGKSSDQLRLPPEIFARPAKTASLPKDSPLLQWKEDQDNDKLRFLLEDKWKHEKQNIREGTGEWRNAYGWGSGRRFKPEELKKCRLYVTCEPCIMCAAALAQVQIGKVYFGCRNDKFGGCGSILHLHKDHPPHHAGYPVSGGMLEDDAVGLLRSFYNRENFHAPEDKRKRKEGKDDSSDVL